MNIAPVYIFPWQRPFLTDIRAFLDRISEGRPGSVLLITPHSRPWRYLTQLYADSGYKGLLPRCLPLADAITLWRARSGTASLHMAGELDRVAALHSCVLRIAQEDERLAARFAHMDMAAFFPWGLRLGNLFEEMLVQCITAQDLLHVEEEVAQPAADLLGALGRIGKAYLDELRQRGWTTPGLDAYTVATCDGSIPTFFQPTPERPVVMAGFARLTGSEDVLLRRLWNAGGHMCLHADPALVVGTGYHWSCDILADVLRRWRAKAELAVTLEPHEAAHRPRISFFAGYDVHSQLQEIRAHLTSESVNGGCSTAVILTDTSLLLPTLHHMPDKNVNISMGYPLIRSPLYHLLEAILRLGETRTEDGRYYWRTLLQCLHHPYVHRLCALDSQGNSLHLHTAVLGLEKDIRRGTRFVNCDFLLAQHASTVPPPLRHLLDEMAVHLLHRPCAAETLDDIAVWLLGLCDFLLRHGGDLWQRFPLDAEAMYRLARHVVPALRHNSLTHTLFPRATLHSILRQILRQERVPFEAEPLTGLQILGMLETRLLHFDRIFILDATDDKLPGNPAQDPLLPDSLRHVLGLPSAYGREQTASYTFYRLCAGATDIHCYWQEGITRSTLFDGKKTRSRFVEQLLWQEERRRGTLLSPGDPPLFMARCVVRPNPIRKVQLERTVDLAAVMEQFLSKPLSATRLDVYLQCPLCFARKNLCRLMPVHEVNEEDDPTIVGTCIHETLRTLFAPYLHRDLHKGDITFEKLKACFAQTLMAANLQNLLPPDSYFMLEETAPGRLWQFLQNQPDVTHIVSLEEKLNAVVHLGKTDYAFTGIMDRLDRRENGLHILDYKTGILKKHDAGLWKDGEFFQRIRTLCDSLEGCITPDVAALETLEYLFTELCNRLPSVQLPCYSIMAQAAGIGPLGDAALVELRTEGKEYSLFGGLEGDELHTAMDCCVLALRLIVLHMRRMPFFAARPGSQCKWCHYAGLCSL